MKMISRLSLIAVSLFCLQLSPGAHADAPAAVITHLEGEASILRDGQLIPATLGEVCRKSDQLQTSADGHVDLALNGMAGCRVLPQSQVSLQKTDSQDMHLKIENGNIILNVKKLPKDTNFKVETPTAIAAVRGTQFWGRVDAQKPDNPVTTFAVREGSVEIFSKIANQSFAVEQGQAIDLPAEGATLPVIRPALAEELEAMKLADAIKTSA